MDPKWEDELESHRFEMTRVLRPDRYFEKFRSERILDEFDTQVINNETKNPTRDKKAGQFLDIVRERGHVAYKLLLECMEADHPDLYMNITGINPEPKSWTIGLSKTCSCECHDDRISLDLMEAYKKEKQQNISLRRELEKFTKTYDKGLEEKLKLKHVNETMKKQLDVLQSETGEVQKLKDEIQWKRFQICDLQAKAYEAQTQLISSNDKLRKVNLENNALENKVREAQARLTLQRKKSTRLEQERSTDRMQASETLRSLVDQLHELGLDRAKKMEDKPPVNNDVHDQTKLDIMVADKEEAVTKCEETVNELVKVRKQLYEVQEAKTKLEAENEELDTADTLLRDERDTVMERLEMAQEELTQVSAERSQAISERNRSFEETARSMLERDELVKKLNNERQAFLKQTRQLFEHKSKVQQLKRDKRLLRQDGHQSLTLSVSIDGSNDSKRSSGANEVSYLEGGNAGAPSTDTAKPTTVADGSPSTQLHTKRSISQINQSGFDADDDDDFVDYEYPVGWRKRSQVVSHGEIPAAVRERRASNASKSDNPGELTSRPDRNEDRDSGNVSGIDQANESSDRILDSLPCDVDEKIGTLWSDFDYSASSGSRDSKPEERRPEERPILRPSLSSGMSTEVNVGSLKDKKRRPGPRLSSCDVPPSNYMVDVKLNRRSKTLGSYPDDPLQSTPEH
ncbi:caspase recruitment domain-containing protein 14-like [Strongylocentrotus purpuratus]|uniref:CARD domain-containing protein n=1 Tax=Strongylocentrotus purpuratus TaxID=7668 RepID=A0A7M7P9P2_STRPU|nr:caspase recruitment domain-containing protein 14-like [Strongylocentrotus purpuratus]